MSKPRRRLANAWPRWKLALLLPSTSRWTRLQLVQLDERGHPWQFLTIGGRPAGVGLFDTREAALSWARTHCDDVLEAMVEATP